MTTSWLSRCFGCSEARSTAHLAGLTRRQPPTSLDGPLPALDRGVDGRVLPVPDHLEASGSDVPEPVRRIRGRESLELVWRNVLGGSTYRVGAGTSRDRFIKWAPVTAVELDLAAEAERLVWAVAWLAVPRVLESGTSKEGSWLVTAALPGRPAVDPRWRHQPEQAVKGIGHGLRRLHDQLPIGDCPFSWSIQDRTDHLDPEAAASLAQSAPLTDKLVVCHGDACAPNTLLDDTGRVTGHVDFGSLGVADRWADLAVALWSLEYNWGIGWDGVFLDAYGVDCDADRVAYYQRLWHAA